MIRVCQLITVATMCLTGVVSVLRAQSCGGNGDFGGSYAFLASRIAFAGVPMTAPGTSGAQGSGSTGGTTTGTGSGTTGTTASTFSNTPFGQMIGGMSGSSPFAAVGRVLADGAGSLLASSTPSGGLTVVGSYTVNPDCTVSMTLNDVFVGMPVTPPGTAGAGGAGSSGGSGTGSGGNSSGSAGNSNGTTGTTTATPASIKIEGISLDHGAEVDLAQPGTANTGGIITMRRAVQFGGCTAANVSGAFGLVAEESVGAAGAGSGGSTGATNSSSLGVLSLVGRLVADGTGIFLQSPQATQSVLPDSQLTGTYTVADDCSGTAQFVDNLGVTHNADFMIVQAGLTGGNAGAPQVILPELLFSFTDQGVAGTGFAKHQ